jgi:tetratricopeptide (TPR) repeat protein
MSPDTSIIWCGPNALAAKVDSPSRLEDFLKADHRVSCLLVLDPNDRFKHFLDTTFTETVIAKLEEFKGTVIVLARSIQDGSLLAGPRDICELHGLEADASISLLRERLGPRSLGKAAEDQLDQVVRSMACSPRAILQLSSFLNNSGMQVSQLLDLYHKNEEISLRLFSRQESRLKFDDNTSIIRRGVFDVDAFRATYPDSVRILFQLYFLGGASVPSSIFATVDHLDMIIMMGILKGHFLLARTEDDTLTLHPLVFLAIKKVLELDERKADDPAVKEEMKWHEAILVDFSKQYPGADCKKRDWWATWFPSILSNYKVQADSLRVAVATIHDKNSKFFLCEGDYAKALNMASEAIEALPDPIPVQYLHILENKLSILDLLARYGDVRFALEKYHHEKLPPRLLFRKQRFQARLHLAECTDGYNSAVRILNDIRTSGLLNGADHWRSMTDYAVALMLKGNFKEAEGQSRDALAMKTKHLGPDHRDTLTSAHVLAEVLMKAGKFDEGLHHIQHAFHGRGSVLGSQHPDTLHSKMICASLLFAKALTLGDYEEAEKMLLDCSSGLTKVLSDRHPLVLTSNSVLALVQFAQGKYNASEKLNGTVLAARQNGPWQESKSHPDSLTSMHQLMEVFRLGGRLSAADEMSKFILDERTRVLTKGSQTGNDFHPDQLSSFHHRAIVLSLRGSQATGSEATNLHVEAVRMIDMALKGRAAILGPEHPDVFFSMTWRGEILRAEQRSQNLYPAERAAKLNAIDGLHSDALKSLTLIFGPEHRNTLQCKINLAAAKLERETLSHFETAYNLYNDVFSANCRNLGELHPETLKSKTSLARAMKLADPKKHDEAKRLWMEACGGFAKVFGLDGLGTVTAYREYEEFFAANKK